MTNTTTTIAPEALQGFLTDLFHATGMPEDDARHSAHALVQTNLWGIDSHGILRAPVYLKRLRNRAMNPTPSIEVVRGAGAFEVMTGDDGVGFVVGRAAMQRAIELAREHSVGAVGVVRSNHFGAAGLYTRLAADHDMIGIAMTNVMPNMVAPGGSKPITGNNPLAISIPTFDAFPLMLDISLSNASGGKILLASKKGERIPRDWATNKQGQPTDDPDEAFAGFLLTMGGHKGLGLSYMIDILSGLITGGTFQFGIKSMYKHADDPSLTGHFMIAINPLAVIDRAEMQARMASFVQTVKESPMWDSTQEMLLPGELEHRTALKRAEDGIPLPQNLYDELVALGQELGIKTSL